MDDGGDGLEEDSDMFSVSTSRGDWTCTRVIVATGLSVEPPYFPNREPDIFQV